MLKSLQKSVENVHIMLLLMILDLPRFCFHFYASQNAVSMQWFGKNMKIISVIQILYVLIAIYILVSMRSHCLKVC